MKRYNINDGGSRVVFIQMGCISCRDSMHPNFTLTLIGWSTQLCEQDWDELGVQEVIKGNCEHQFIGIDGC